jgi:hypothetical protein
MTIEAALLKSEREREKIFKQKKFKNARVIIIILV